MTKRDNTKAQITGDLEQLRQEKQSAQALLCATEQKLRAFMESASDGFLLLDADLRVVDVTYRDLSGLGIPPESIIGRPIEEVSPGFKVEGRLEQLREVLRTGEPFTVEDFVPAWPPAWQSKRLSQKVFKVGEGIGLVITDISKQKQAEMELRQSEASYRLLAENVTDVIWTVDDGARLTYVSPSIKQLLGYEPVEVLGKSALTFLAMPQGKDVRDLLRRYLLRERAGPSDVPRSLSIELELAHKNGNSIWTETILSSFRSEYQASMLIVGVTRDVSERKQAEELFQTLADNTPVGVYMSQRGRLVFVNEQFAQCVGRSIPDLIGLPTSSFIVSDDRSMARKSAIAMLKGESQASSVFRYVTDNGHIRWAMERVASVRLRGERTVLGNLMDITKAKEDEEALRTSEKELRLLSQRVLEIQDEERSYIARELHDQLGQEIFALKMEAGLLLENISKGSSLHTRLVSLMGLIDHLQTTCRSIVAGIRLEPHDQLGLRARIQTCAEEFERRSGISCPVQILPYEPALSNAAIAVIHRVFQESLLNIWRHAEATEVNVKLTHEGGCVVLEVCDNGIGFDLSRMKDPSFLGLRGMQERALLLGGYVTIRSGDGRGTSIQLSLPLSQDER